MTDRTTKERRAEWLAALSDEDAIMLSGREMRDLLADLNDKDAEIADLAKRLGNQKAETQADIGGWPGYHTHFTPLPPLPSPPQVQE